MNGKERIEEILEEKAASLYAVSDAIWEYAETRFDSPCSADALIHAAEAEGFRITRGLADMAHAFMAEWGEGAPRIGILAEFDALGNLSQEAGATVKKPVEEGKPGHGCGHNLLGAGALAGAIAARQVMEESGKKGTVILYGCPSEESGYGKAFMARAGVFDGLDAVLTWHPFDNNAAWSMSSLAVSQIYFNFKGVSAHAAAAPHMGRSALDAAELMNIGVNFLREHIIDAARIHYAFLDVGGESANVVQPTASLYYFIRAPKQSQVKEIVERVEKIARGAALMTETELEIVWDSACHDYMPNRTLTREMHRALGEFLPLDLTPGELAFARDLAEPADGKAQAARIRRAHPNWSDSEIEVAAKMPVRLDLDELHFDGPAMMGSTDVGDVSWVAPTAQVMIACEPVGTPPHSWQWVANGKSGLAHKGVLLAGKTLAATVWELLERPELLEQAAREHEANLAGETYRSAIPPDVKPR